MVALEINRADVQVEMQPDLFARAVHLMGGIAPAHAFEDGNKRLAYVRGLTFRRLSGVRITAPRRRSPIKSSLW